MGGGTGDRVGALASSGADLYVGASFATAGGLPASRLAKWNGSAWSALGSGVSSNVNAIAIQGSDVYVGGRFSSAGGVSASRLARWDGTR